MSCCSIIPGPIVRGPRAGGRAGRSAGGCVGPLGGDGCPWAQALGMLPTVTTKADTITIVFMTMTSWNR